MPLIKYVPKVSPWENYFTQQAEMQMGKRQNKSSAFTTFLNPTVSADSGFNKPSLLTKITQAQDTDKKDSNEEIKVNLVSPAESAVEIAESEMEGVLKEGDQTDVAISKLTTKQAVSSSGTSLLSPASRKRKRQESQSINPAGTTFRDIFVKNPKIKKKT